MQPQKYRDSAVAVGLAATGGARQLASAPVAAVDTDEGLLARYCTGDPSAMEALVKRWHRRLFHFATRMVGDAASAEDVVQETFIRVLQHAHRYNPSGRFSTWLFAICANLCRDELKRRRRHPAVSLEEWSESGTPLPVMDNGHGCEEFDRALTNQVVSQALGALSPDQRLAVVLRHYHGFSYEEIAQMTKVPVGTAKSRVHHGLKELRYLLRDVVVGEG